VLGGCGSAAYYSDLFQKSHARIGTDDDAISDMRAAWNWLSKHGIVAQGVSARRVESSLGRAEIVQEREDESRWLYNLERGELLEIYLKGGVVVDVLVSREEGYSGADSEVK
jgi:hypothetical protein